MKHRRFIISDNCCESINDCNNKEYKITISSEKFIKIGSIFEEIDYV